MDINETRKIVENLHTRKGMGLDDISDWILHNYSERLIEKIHSSKVTSLEKAEVPSDLNWINREKNKIK